MDKKLKDESSLNIFCSISFWNKMYYDRNQKRDIYNKHVCSTLPTNVSAKMVWCDIAIRSWLAVIFYTLILIDYIFRLVNVD